MLRPNTRQVKQAQFWAAVLVSANALFQMLTHFPGAVDLIDNFIPLPWVLPELEQVCSSPQIKS